MIVSAKTLFSCFFRLHFTSKMFKDCTKCTIPHWPFKKMNIEQNFALFDESKEKSAEKCSSKIWVWDRRDTATMNLESLKAVQSGLKFISIQYS